MKRFGDQKLLMYHAFVSAKDAASSLASQALGSHKFLQLKALEALESRSSNLKIVNADHTWHRHQELTVNLSSNPQKRVACVVSSRVRISASIRIERGSTRILGGSCCDWRIRGMHTPGNSLAHNGPSRGGPMPLRK